MVKKSAGGTQKKKAATTARSAASRAVKKRVSFQFEAPRAKAVSLAGSFNDWSTSTRPLKQDGKGVWRTWMMMAPGSYEYRFLVDGEWQDDPACEQRRENEFGSSNCVLEV